MAVKAPTGLSIARKNNIFTCSWKLGQKYDGVQQVTFRTNKEKWTAKTEIGKAVTARNYTLNAANYYPRKNNYLTFIEIAVRGRMENKKLGWSDYGRKQFPVEKPKAPSVKATPSTSEDNLCTFSWTTATAENDKYMFADCEYQTMLVTSNTTDGSKLAWKASQPGWQTGAVAANSNIQIRETGAIATGSHTRWFRIRSRGPAGASDWRYARRVYAAPYQPKITKTKTTRTSAGGANVLIEWTNQYSAAYPIENLRLEYVTVEPEAGMKCPDEVTWADASTLAVKGTTNAASIYIDKLPGTDKCTWVRVVAVHLNKETPSAPALAITGNLDAPSITNVVTEPSTYRATVTAANPSQVPGAFVVILYRTAKEPAEVATIGIIPAGETSATVQCPNWTDAGGVEFGIYAAVGSYTSIVRADGVTSYTVKAQMRSPGVIWQGGSVPQAPTTVTASATDTPGTIRVTWDWPWEEATGAIISWSDHEDAWESTNPPQEFEITNLHASAWNIADLTTGQRWWVKVRLTDGENAGDWSEAAVIDLSSAPNIPALTLSAGVIIPGGSVTAYWGYTSTDGTGQAYAEICEATITEGEITYGEPIAATETAQNITLYADDQGWDVGETHYLCVRVVSGSGIRSDNWSDPAAVTIAEALEIEITETSLEEETITVDGESRTIYALSEMPLTATITGAGAGGTTTLTIERAEDYHVNRPDLTDFNGYEGETIAVIQQTGQDEIEVTRDDLLGSLDDGARYRLIATIQDGLGQSASEYIDFEVHWQHQAILPEGSARIDAENLISIITPEKPSGWAEGDTCDIYRLTADRPELIVQGGDFGVEYVDPYPAIGAFGGHRIVYRTIDGDYITENNELAWLDLTEEDGDILDIDYAIIDFNGEQIFVRYNMDFSYAWAKDFKETKYLGGSVTGDWNKAISRTGTVNAVTVTTEDPETIQAVRRLATYAGICHIRTQDGSSFACDIQVNDNMTHQTAGKIYVFSLAITRVDTEGLDGLTYQEWLGEPESE